MEPWPCVEKSLKDGEVMWNRVNKHLSIQSFWNSSSLGGLDDGWVCKISAAKRRNTVGCDIWWGPRNKPGNCSSSSKSLRWVYCITPPSCHVMYHFLISSMQTKKIWWASTLPVTLIQSSKSMRTTLGLRHGPGQLESSCVLSAPSHLKHWTLNDSSKTR